jgi:hypothetical protein
MKGGKMKKSEKMVSAILVTVILIWISVLTMMASVSVGAAATYYVAPTGDANPGKIDQPWRTIPHAAETVAAGDTVYYIMAGTGIDVKDGSSN